MKKLLIITIILWAVLIFLGVRYSPKQNKCVQLGASPDDFSSLTDRVIAKDPTLSDVEAENFMQLYNKNNANIIRFNKFIKQ